MKKTLFIAGLILTLCTCVFAAEAGESAGAAEGGKSPQLQGGEKQSAAAFKAYNEGYTKYLAHNYKDALKDFNKAIKLKPEYAKSYNFAGLAYAAMKKNNHAIHMYKRAIKADPVYSEAYHNMGIAFEIKKDRAAAESFYRKAIELDNDRHIFVRSSLNLAEMLRQDKKFDEALEILRKAMIYEPNFAELQRRGPCLP